MNTSKYLIVKIYFCFLMQITFAQQSRSSVIRGVIQQAGKPLEYASVSLKGEQVGTVSDGDGNFVLRVLPGKHILVVEHISCATYESSFDIKPEEKIFVRIQMSETTNVLEEVVVQGKSPLQRINQSPMNVQAVNTKELRNTNLDVARVLDKVSGVKIRQDGGLGSAAQINLNGFSGKHVRVFIDGVPLEGMGNSFQINNIPLSITERIEIYKGVIPIEFGSDALGGAINIVTDKTARTRADVSYSYGSFNTHKSSVNVGHTTQSGVTMSLNAYQNYSDNNYKVFTEYLDVENNQFSTDKKWFNRFHDRYHNEAVIGKIGVVKQSWADRFNVGFTYSREYQQIQNANLMQIAFGGKYRKANGISSVLNYEKHNFLMKNLDVSLTARYDIARNNNVDTLSRQYSWTGNYRSTTSRGEAGTTLAEFDNKTGHVTIGLGYKTKNTHLFSLHNTYSHYGRKTTDSQSNHQNSTQATFMKRINEKNILGISYKITPNHKWNASVFAKHYYTQIKGPVNVSTTTRAIYEEQNRYNKTWGYGGAGTYHFTKEIQTKASFEKTYRLPTDRELFGDGDLEMGDASVRPENSRNFNFNIAYNPHFKAHSFSIEGGFIYRNIKDYIIRYIGNQGTAQSRNHGNVQNVGGEFSLRYFYKDKWTAGGALTYMNIRNKERLNSNGAISLTYNDRLPNTPYFFANADINYIFHNLFGKKNSLSLGYGLQYVHEYFRSWQSEGAKRTIPEQLSHDVSATFSFGKKKYNVAFEIANLTNRLLYDNFSLQKPGRSFSIKFRYSPFF